jgi:hypothetical protein
MLLDPAADEEDQMHLRLMITRVRVSLRQECGMRLVRSSHGSGQFILEGPAT